MLKRFYSKRSGFTLVEIIVAFAVFAIMASMIAQILDLSIRARNANNQYARELARQEKLLTVIRKDGSLYNDVDKTGEYSIAFTKGGAGFTMGYQVKATDPAAENQAEGINYFVSPLDYNSSGTAGEYETNNPDAVTDVGGMSQASRMDTRITGTSGIGAIMVYSVIKDEFNYPDDSKYKLEPGHTRYFIEVSASSKDEAGNLTLVQDNVPYSQYKMYFFSDELDAAESAIVYDKDKNGGYTKNVYKKAKVLASGHVDKAFDDSNGVIQKGLTDSNSSLGTDTDGDNKYTVQSFGNNCVRIGTPFEYDYTNGNKRGIRFDPNNFTRFYVEFEGDPHLTCESFGHNADKDKYGNTVYRAVPQYEDKYKADGTPEYDEKDDGSVHPSIYGAYMYTKNYKGTSSDTPEKPETPEGEE